MEDEQQHQTIPWCTLESYTKFCMCGACTLEELREIAATEFTPRQIKYLYDVILDPKTCAENRADAIYVFVNKCVTQRRPIRPEETVCIVQSIVPMLPRFKSIKDSYWIVKVLLDLYEHDQHMLDLKATHTLVDWLMHVTTDPTDEVSVNDPSMLMNHISAVITLVSGMFCYGFDDCELGVIGLPIEIERPTDAQNLSCIFGSAQFCRGIVRLLLYATTTFDKWFERESLFHWDLAIIATIVKNRVLKFPALCDHFDRIVIEKLFDNSSDYTSLVVLSKTSPLPWKRPILECISIALTGSSSYLLGIALVDQTSGTRRFGLFIHTLLKQYGSIENVRKACMENPVVSPQPVARAVTMLMALSGRDRSHIARMMRRLNQASDLAAPTAEPSPPPRHPESKKLDEEFLAELVREEEEERRRSSLKSQTSASAGKKKKKNKKASNKKATATPADAPPPAATAGGDTDDDSDDDNCIYEHYRVKKPTNSTTDVAPLPFGDTVKKRPHRKRKPIRPLSVLEPVREESPAHEAVPEPSAPTNEAASEPAPPTNEPAPEPAPPTNEHSPEPAPPTNEAVPEPAPPTNEVASEPAPPANEAVPSPNDTVFEFAHIWTRPFPSYVMSAVKPNCFPARIIVQNIDVLRWTPLVYAYAARASLEKSAGVVNPFCT